MKVKISYRAPTVEYDCMPEFLYFEWLDVVEETENTIKVKHPDTPTVYEFKKEYIKETYS